MNAEMWKRAIGESAWDHIGNAATKGQPMQDAVAAMLTAATEVGFKVPEQRPMVSAGGRKVLWEGPEGSVVPVLTAAGLLAHWSAKGHGFLLLRAGPLCRAVAGMSLARLQEILHGYEAQCEQEGVTPLPGWADIRAFVGGEFGRVTGTADALTSGLFKESPNPKPTRRATARTVAE